MNLNRKGVSLLFAIFLLLIFSFIGMILMTILTNESLSSSEELIYKQVLYLAESGCEIAVADNITGGNGLAYTNDLVTLVFNNFDIEISRKIYDNITVYECLAKAGNIKRKVMVKLKR